jgi:hypothetical protein
MINGARPGHRPSGRLASHPAVDFRLLPLIRTFVVVAASLVASSALALPAGERGVLDISGGLGSLTAIAVNDAGTIVAAADRDLGGIYVWHEAAFSSPVEMSGCDGAVSVIFVAQSTLGDRFYVGCADGVVLRVGLDESTIPPTLDLDPTILLNEGVGTVTELAWSAGDLYVHAIVQDGSNWSVHRFSVSDTFDIDGLGLPLSATGTVSAITAGVDSGSLIVVDTNGVLNWVSRGTTYSAATTPPVVVQGSSVDMVNSDRVGYSLWTDRTAGDVWSISHTSSSTAATRFLTGLPEPSAIAIVDDGLELRVWVGLLDGTIEAYGAADGLLDGTLTVGSGYVTEFAAPATGDDPVFAAGSDSTVRVITDRPWISDVEASPDSVQSGDSFTVTFTVDASGTYDIRSDGPDPDDGTSLASGAATADEEVSVELSVDDLDDEGENRLFVFVEDDDGDVGKDSFVVTKDTPPDTVANLAAEGGNNKLIVTWTSSDEPDIASYELYLSDQVFTSSDAPLPAFAVLVDVDTDDERTDEYPAEVTWEGVSTVHTLTIEGLVNDTTYYLSIVAIDEAELESSASPVIIGVPVATCAASECADDTYGCTCAPNSLAAWRPVRPGAVALAMMLLASLIPAMRRR